MPPNDLFSVINPWLLPFALGIFLSQRDLIPSISRLLRVFRWWRFIILITAIMLVAAFRPYIPLFGFVKIDWLFGGLIIIFVFEVTTSFEFVEGFLGFLGKHLFNVFLFHTFVSNYYCSDFIYSLKYPFLIFIALLSVCIAMSVIIEQYGVSP